MTKSASNVVNLAKRRAWRDLKRRFGSGKIMLPAWDVPEPKPLTSDFALALGYALQRYGESVDQEKAK